MIDQTKTRTREREALPGPRPRRTMRTTTKTIGALLTAALMIIVAGYVVRAVRGAEPVEGGAVLTPTAAATTEPGLDRLIGVFESRRDAGQFADLKALGSLYLQRGRATGSIADYHQADRVIAEALARDPDEPELLTSRAAAALALHRFSEAYEVATDVAVGDPSAYDAVAIAGDAALTLGDLDTARQRVEQLMGVAGGDPAVLVRLSQIQFAEGDPGRATSTAHDALDQALTLGFDEPAIAFYHTFIATLAFDTGDYEAALDAVDRAIATDPGYVAAWGERGSALAALGRIDEAIESIASAPGADGDPGAQIALGELELVRGRPEAAERHFAVADTIVSETEGTVYDLMYAEFLADRERDVARALELTTAELSARRDLHALDGHAWALYRNGRFEEAKRFSDEALAIGTLEAPLYYHAGAIAAASGDIESARQHLVRALELSPEFHPLAADEARRLLAELGG